MPRYATLREIADAGYDIRIWCCWCCRAVTLEIFASRKLWGARFVPLARLREHLVCKACRSRDALVLPASRPKPPPEPPPTIEPEKERTWKQEVEHWFFNVRPSYKMRKRR